MEVGVRLVQSDQISSNKEAEWRIITSIRKGKVFIWHYLCGNGVCNMPFYKIGRRDYSCPTCNKIPPSYIILQAQILNGD